MIQVSLNLQFNRLGNIPKLNNINYDTGIIKLTI
jgi:hypothetical protein